MSQKLTHKLYVITGPTASGKTSKAVALASSCAGEIISADSRQLYRNMDLGTGKDLDEYGIVPYHMINICDAGYKYNLYEYLRDFNFVYNDITTRGKTPILCGGTGLYIESVLNGICLPEVPENKELRVKLSTKTLEELTAILKQYKTLHNTTDVDTVKRAIRAIEIEQYYIDNPNAKDAAMPHPLDDYVIVGLDISRENRRFRISKRLQARIDAGMVNEVRALIESGIAAEDLMYYGLEYKYLTLYVIGKISYRQMFTELETAIHQFAKRQMTWFRGMERRGFKINWLPYDIPDAEFIEIVSSL